MLERPDLSDERIIACLQTEYGLHIVQVTFLPLGFGLSTAVYRAIADDEAVFFCKLRRDVIDVTLVQLARFLSNQGIAQIIPPLATSTGQLCAELGDFSLIVYPFVAGKSGYDAALTDRQWVDFGAALKRIQTTIIPPALIGNIQKETYTSRWRERCKQFVARLDIEPTDDPVVAGLAALLRSKRDVVLSLIEGAEHLAPILVAHDLEFVLCHSDLHPGNLLIGEQGNLHIVDWDYPTLAPKERDLMYIGGGYGFLGRTSQEQEALFYSGYGDRQIDPIALAYYRYERSTIAIAVACELILSGKQDVQTRAQALEYLKYYFRPNGSIETALESNVAASDLARPVQKKALRGRRMLARGFISLAMLLFAWQLTVRLSNLPPFILPSPTAVWLRFLRTLADRTLLVNSAITLAEVLTGLIVGALFATVMGYLMAKSRLLDDLLSPFLVASQAVPFVAIAPLLIIWFGPGILSKILICSLMVFFPVLINTVVGVRAVPVGLYNLMHSLRATPTQILWNIEIPAALPLFLSGLRIGATLSVIGAVVGEFLGANRGLGFLVNVGRGQFDTPLVYVSVFVLIAMALTLYGGVAWIEHRALNWQDRKG